MIIRRGDIYYADLRPVVGSEQGGVRPVLVIQNDVGNKHSPTVICAAITSRMNKAKLPTHVELSSRDCDMVKDSVILLEQLRTIDKQRLREKICHIDGELLGRVDEALKQVGMYEYRHHAPHLLSGGQKQRVAIAGVIAMRPQCIVLDEPTAMLDPQGRQEVISTIERLNRENGITVVLITHHMTEAIRAQRVVVMEKGSILADGTPKQVFVQVELLKSAGLTVPATTELLYELNKAGFDLPLDALSTEECAQALFACFREKA